jgi:hypothetical protein
MSAVDNLTSQVTQEQALAALKTWILSAPSPPEEITLDTPGTPENEFLWMVSLAEESRSDDRARYALAAFRSTAPIEYLRIIAVEVFGLPVQVAGYATTPITITNTSGNQYGPFEPGELRFVDDATKAIFENTVLITIEPAQLSPFEAWTESFASRAIASGTGSNAEIGDINRLETALEGVTVTNAAAALTVDDETAESINRRIDARIGLFGIAGAGGMSSGGPETAVESIALSGSDNGGGCVRADGTRIEVTRVKLVRDDATGISTLYVADDDGPLNSDDLDVLQNGPSTGVISEIVWYAQRVCSRVEVENTSVATIAPEAAIKIRKTSLTDAQIRDAINAAFPAAALAVPIGGFDITPSKGVPKEYVEGAIRGALAGKVVLVDITLSVPSGTTTTAEDKIIEFTAVDDTTLTITRIQ